MRKALIVLAVMLSGCAASAPVTPEGAARMIALQPHNQVTYSEMRKYCRLVKCVDENGILIKHNPPIDADIESRCKLNGGCIPDNTATLVDQH